jgi:membrane protease YdiL (CAAX protease family)
MLSNNIQPQKEVQKDSSQHLPPDLKKQERWSWVDLLIIVFGILLILFLGAVIFVALMVAMGQKPENLVDPTISQTLGLTMLESVALILGIYLFGLRRKGLDWSAVGFRQTSWLWIGISIGATLIIIPIVGFITLVFFFLTGQPIENPQLDFLLPEGLSAGNAVLMLLLGGFVAPLAEELFFRGVLYTFLRERWGIWLSVFLSSFLFGLIHGDIAVGITGFLLGVVAALVFEYSKSLWTAVIVHVINNSLKIALLYVLVYLGMEI